MKAALKLETVEELVAYTLQLHAYAKDTRWKLGERYRKNDNDPADYYLSKGNSYYTHNVIELSHDLGKMLNDIWTKGPRFRGSTFLDRKGTLTMPGMLKRLGKTDIADKLKEAEAKEKAEQEKRNRNYARKQIREAAEKLHDLVSANNALLSEFIDLMPENFMPAIAHLRDIQDE